MSGALRPYKDPTKTDSYSCEIKINGSLYSLTPLTCSDSKYLDFVRGFRLEKQDAKRPGVYDVIQTRSGVECDCPDFQHRRQGLDSLGCKHMRAMYYFGFLSRNPDPAATSSSTKRRWDFPDGDE